MTLFNERIPKTDRELEIFYRQTIDKLKGTESTLVDESLKSFIPFISMVQSLNRNHEALAKSIKTNRATMQKLERQQQENRILKAQLSRLEKRVADIEKEIP